MKFKVGDYVIPIDKKNIDFLRPEFINGFIIQEFDSLTSTYARPTKGETSGIEISKIRLAKPITKEQKDKLLNMIREI